MATKISNQVKPNTPRGIDANDLAQFPSAFSVEKMLCINSVGAEYDINPLVKSFTITEELFSPLIVLNLKIRDDQNFFESFSLNGEEKIYLHVRRKAYVSNEITDEEFKLKFAVKEYPNYAKSAQQPNIQEYDIIAVSEFGYNSALTKMSKAVDGNPIENLRKIFLEKLSIEAVSVGVLPCVSTFRGIITTRTPLKAIEWLRSKSFDEYGSPFFVFSNLYDSNRVRIQSLADLWRKANPVIRKYEYRQMVLNPVSAGKQHYIENATRILDMRSNIKLDKLDAATRGAYASTTTTTDISSKSIVDEVFDYGNAPALQKVALNPKPGYSLLSTIAQAFTGKAKSSARTLNQLSKASITNISTNSGAFSNGVNSSSVSASASSTAKSFYASFENVSHQVLVYGDFKLSVGRKIHITIPKSIDPTDISKEELAQIDEAMSGEYIIAVAAHVFSEGKYTTKLKIVRNTV